ncbi:HIG1 domain-containing protein [Altererythrobacter arenosus]|uniref:HIG1 domain-containing protein n=1 Tax=Altererythrobacter arenosus TaxID=3032592 RepID=A0ABY8G1X3_9SPHN|nr:HIG1 domain-containing protein [Altererythrobacter sp. CAU 1644]WFL78874.1 HIG1 domain-containing protein [Altererythrobacter sp. CAU 1644]
MTTLLIIVLAILCLMVVVSLVRGIIAFLQTTKVDLENNTSENITEMQLMQNRAMFARIKYQALAVVVVAIILMISR